MRVTQTANDDDAFGFSGDDDDDGDGDFNLPPFPVVPVPVVVDLPFIVNVNNNGKFKSKIAKRFDYFKSEKELYEANKSMIELAYSKLKIGGFLVMKTMDVCGPSKQLWINNYV